MSKLPFTKKYAFYTAIFGSYDDLHEPRHAQILDEADFFCFTDNKALQSSNMNIIYVERAFGDDTLNARYVKIMEHPVLADYAYTIWFDANLQLEIKSLEELPLNLFTDYPIITFQHSLYSCLYDQALLCIYAYNDFYYKIIQQILYYKIKGMPVNFGLYETNFLIKNHTHPGLLKLQNDWWKEVHSRTRRDQISLPFCAWKNNLQIGILEGSGVCNRFTTYLNHKLRDSPLHKPYLRAIRKIEKDTPFLRLYVSRVAKIIKLL